MLTLVQTLDTSRCTASTVTGASMLPSFREGDVLFLETATPDALRVGDVVLYESDEHPGAVVTHRLIWRDRRRDSSRFFLKGDAYSKIAVLCHGRNGRILGRVTARSRQGRPAAPLTLASNHLALARSLLSIPIQKALGR